MFVDISREIELMNESHSLIPRCLGLTTLPNLMHDHFWWVLHAL